MHAGQGTPSAARTGTTVASRARHRRSASSTTQVRRPARAGDARPISPGSPPSRGRHEDQNGVGWAADRPSQYARPVESSPPPSWMPNSTSTDRGGRGEVDDLGAESDHGGAQRWNGRQRRNRRRRRAARIRHGPDWSMATTSSRWRRRQPTEADDVLGHEGSLLRSQWRRLAWMVRFQSMSPGRGRRERQVPLQRSRTAGRSGRASRASTSSTTVATMRRRRPGLVGQVGLSDQHLPTRWTSGSSATASPARGGAGADRDARWRLAGDLDDGAGKYRRMSRANGPPAGERGPARPWRRLRVAPRGTARTARRGRRRSGVVAVQADPVPSPSPPPSTNRQRRSVRPDRQRRRHPSARPPTLPLQSISLPSRPLALIAASSTSSPLSAAGPFACCASTGRDQVVGHGGEGRPPLVEFSSAAGPAAGPFSLRARPSRRRSDGSNVATSGAAGAGASVNASAGELFDPLSGGRAARRSWTSSVPAGKEALDEGGRSAGGVPGATRG